MNCNFDKISLERNMYKVDRSSLTKILEKLDPSEEYRGTSLEGLDAFSRQLRRFDIKVSDCGKGSDSVEKFFQTNNSSVLFPEFVIRSVKSGMDEDNIIENIVATTTNIDSMDYRPMVSVPKDNEEPLPPLAVNIQENLIKIHKRGRMLMTSYEALKYQKIDLFFITLKQIGSFIRKMQLFDCIKTITDSIEETTTNNLGTIKSYDIYNIAQQLDSKGFELNTLLTSVAGVKELFTIFDNIQFSNGIYKAHGINIIPIFDGLPCRIVGLDNRYAIEMVQTGGISVDYDKLIDRQFERAAISCSAGFSILHPDAIKIMKW